MAVDPVPEGLHTVTPYFHVAGAGAFIDFLKQAFGAEESYRAAGADGRVRHASVRIGDSVIELADGSDEFPPMASAIHLYVPDVDTTYGRATTYVEDIPAEEMERRLQQFMAQQG